METGDISLDEHKFRLHVVESLTRLEVIGEATTSHLARLNGSVARHEERIGTIQASMVDQAAERRTVVAWWARLSPLVWLAVGGVIAMFLMHGKELLQVFKG
jgi:hypothetical protein